MKPAGKPTTWRRPEILLLIMAACLPIMLAGLYVGGHIHTALSQKAFQTIISIVLLISGSSLVFK